MTNQQAKAIHHLVVDGKWQEAANLATSMIGQPPASRTQSQSVAILRSLFQHLLDAENYLAAATLQWGPDVFLTEPESVVRAFQVMVPNNKILMCGGSSLGKTYGVGAWMLLDYLRDPYYTSVKLAAISEKHLKENLFPHLVKLWRNLAIPSAHNIEVRESDLWMGIKAAGFEFGVSGIAFKQSQETSGQFKGYKSMPVRKRPHPKFGHFSRLRVLGDEGQNWPGGPFQDFNSLIASMDGPDKIKIVMAFNPENTHCRVVQMAEPDQGWNSEDMETLYDWVSKKGWTVCRLDAAKCENVIQKKTVYEGLQTYEGYLGYLKDGGDNSAAYSCFARGWPPMKGSIDTIIPPGWPQQARGEATFIDNPIILGSVDLAFMGKDSAQMAVARWGLASGWRDHMGIYHPFFDRLNVKNAKPRHLLQIDQILPMQKHDDTVRMAEEIMGRAKMMQILPENLIVDKTSIGLGVHSHLNKVWGASQGVSWNEKATSQKILAEDLSGADEQCEGIIGEMWWTFRRWIDPTCCAILINPIVPVQPLNTELTSRRRSTGKAGKIVVENKEKYKARNGGMSPDSADAVIMLTLLVRKNGDVLPGLVEQQTKNTSQEGQIKFDSVKNIVTHQIDKDDSLCEDGSEKDAMVS
jgi:hypothetical protein